MIRVYAKPGARFYVVSTGYPDGEFIEDGQGDHVDVRNDSHKVTWFKTKRLATYHPAYVAHCEKVKRDALSMELEQLKNWQVYARKEDDAERFRALYPTGDGEDIDPNDYKYMAIDVNRRGWSWGQAADEILRAAAELRAVEDYRTKTKQELSNG